MLITDKQHALKAFFLAKGFQPSGDWAFKKRSPNGLMYRYSIRQRVLRYEREYRDSYGRLTWQRVRSAGLASVTITPENKIQAAWRFS